MHSWKRFSFFEREASKEGSSSKQVSFDDGDARGAPTALAAHDGMLVFGDTLGYFTVMSRGEEVQRMRAFGTCVLELRSLKGSHLIALGKYRVQQQHAQTKYERLQQSFLHSSIPLF